MLNPDGGDAPPTFLRAAREHLQSRGAGAQYRHVAEELRRLVDELAVAAVNPGDRLLDYGCAETPYRGHFPPTVSYVVADLRGNPRADVELRSDGSVPLPDKSFQLVLSTQVLEHVAEPRRYLDECFRLLEPGRSLVVTTHGLMYYHPDPDDYWRWTCAGLRRDLEVSGFEVRQIRGILGLGAAALQLFQDATVGRLPAKIRTAYMAAMQLAVAAVDRRYSDESRAENNLVLAAVAVRPE